MVVMRIVVVPDDDAPLVQFVHLVFQREGEERESVCVCSLEDRVLGDPSLYLFYS